MLVRDFAGTYRSKTDGELLQLAADIDQMSPEARSALRGELALRRLQHPQPAEWKHEDTPPDPAPSRIRTGATGPLSIREFLQKTYFTWRSQFWTFFQLSLLGSAAGYGVLAMRGYAARQITAQLFSTWRGGMFAKVVLESASLNLGTAFLMLTASFVLFAAISSVVLQMKAGDSPSVQRSLLAIRRHPCLSVKIGLLLFLIFVLALGLIGILTFGAFWVLRGLHSRPDGLAAYVVSCLASFAIFLPCLRLVLAIPAVVLDGIRPGQALFLSDEITEGKWGILAVLLAKYLIAGYVAGMLPFWLRIWMWQWIHLPHWFATAASLAAVTAIEPMLFVGLALLYVDAHEQSATGCASGPEWDHSIEPLSNRF